MYINTSLNITPLGLYYVGSGIDDSMYFKFKTDTTDISQIFDSSVVDVTKFNKWVMLGDLNCPKWWDVRNKQLVGEKISLPNAKYMAIGTEKTQEGYTVYIEWHEM